MTTWLIEEEEVAHVNTTTRSTTDEKTAREMFRNTATRPGWRVNLWMNPDNGYTRLVKSKDYRP